MRPTVKVVQVGWGAVGARPIQPFEGAAPWGGVYADSMVLGLSERLGEQLLEWERARARLIGLEFRWGKRRTLSRGWK
jgi:hypothetical protein